MAPRNNHPLSDKETLLDYWNAAVVNYREHEFVVDDRGNRYTYQVVDEKAEIIAAYFRKLGIIPGDVVSFQVPVWSEFVLITMACLKVGAIINPIGMCYTGKELEYLLNYANSKVFFCPTWYHKTNYEAIIQGAIERLSSLKSVILLDNQKSRAGKTITLREILSEPSFDENSLCLNSFYNDKENLKKTNSNDVAVILYTSGTTVHIILFDADLFSFFFHPLLFRRASYPVAASSTAFLQNVAVLLFALNNR